MSLTLSVGIYLYLSMISIRLVGSYTLRCLDAAASVPLGRDSSQVQVRMGFGNAVGGLGSDLIR